MSTRFVLTIFMVVVYSKKKAIL